jgi:hypothetical protein
MWGRFGNLRSIVNRPGQPKAIASTSSGSVLRRLLIGVPGFALQARRIARGM